MAKALAIVDYQCEKQRLALGQELTRSITMLRQPVRFRFYSIPTHQLCECQMRNIYITFLIAVGTIAHGQDPAPRSSTGDVPPQNQELAPMVIGMAAPEFRKRLPTLESLQGEWESNGKIDFRKGITLCELSVLTYSDAHNRELTLRLLGFGEVHSMEFKSMSGFVAISDDVIVVGFRGTDMNSPRDWLTNVDFLFQTSMGGDRYFHDGFQDSYALFADHIKQYLRGRTVKQVWLTGHSLGGALATCCAYDWIQSGIPLTGLVTFGQPRVANPAMARYLDSKIGDRTLRFRNGDDMVPTVPPAKFFRVRYQHSGREVWCVNGRIKRDALKAAIAVASPESDSPTGDPSVTSSLAVKSEITDEELFQLQQYLRQNQSMEEAMAVPDTLRGRARTSSGGGLLRANALSEPALMQATGMTSRFSDHSSLEYIRVLNDLESRGTEDHSTD